MEIQHRQTYGKLHKSNKKKVVKSIHIGNDEAKLFIDNIILHIEKPTNYSKFFFLIFINSKWMQ